MRRCLILLAFLLSLGVLALDRDRLIIGQQPAGGRGGQPASGDRQPRNQPPANTPAAGEQQPPDGRPAAEPPAAADAPLRTAGDRPINIEHIRLDLKVDLPKKTVDAKATLKVRGLRPLTSVALDAVDFEISKVGIGNGGKDDKPAHFGHHDGKLVIDLEPAWPADKEATLRIDYKVRNPKAGLHFFGPTDAEPEVPLTVWSQGESITNRYWFPCLDRPNQRQTTELIVTVADGFEVLSNGSLVEKTNNPDKTVTFHWLQDKPHPSYLVTLVVGQFDIVKDEWDKIPVLYYVPKGRKDEVANTFKNTPEMIKVFSERFGIRYPWDKYAQVVVEQFSAGGMENTSATTLTERSLMDKRSLLDGDSDSLISHELAHQWWGDMVTCRDWAHTWLNEGFASYMEALWAEHKQGPEEYAYNMHAKGRAAMQGGRNRPIVDRYYADPDRMFDARAYPKGAFVLHMLRQRLGDAAFWKGIQKYGTDNKFQSVETADLRKAMEQVSGRDLERFFYDWTERPGHPSLDVTTEYLPDTKQARIVVKQTQTAAPFQFPLKIVFHGAQDKVVEEEITQKEQQILVSLAERPTGVDIDPNQAVLSEVKETKSGELWLAQLKSPSVVCRIRAIDHFRQSKTPPDREALVGAMGSEKFHGVQQEIARGLADAGGDVCRDALLEGLKQPNARVRRSCLDGLGRGFSKDVKVVSAIKDIIKTGDESYAVEAGALEAYARMQQTDTVAMLMPWLDKPSHREALRSAALNGLGTSKDLSALDTLITWTQKGKPRACRAAALRALGQMARADKITDEQKEKIVKTVSASLDKEGRQMLMASVFTLRQMGKAAAPALPALEALEQNEADGRVRNLVKGAIDQIRSGSEAAATADETKRLKDEVETLKKTQKALQDRLDKLEKAGNKGQP